MTHPSSLAPSSAFPFFPRGRRIVGATLIGLLASGVFMQLQAHHAQTAPPSANAGAATVFFARSDVNQDDKLSKDEASRVPQVYARFDTIDQDSDGFLARHEFMAGYINAARRSAVKQP